MIQKDIIFFGKKAVLACDGNCNKAWGMNTRKKEYFDEDNDEDDYAYLADDELGKAPVNPGSYEGGEGKPLNDSGKLNKWCARECERSDIADTLQKIELRDFSKRVYNCPCKHTNL